MPPDSGKRIFPERVQLRLPRVGRCHLPHHGPNRFFFINFLFVRFVSWLISWLLGAIFELPEQQDMVIAHAQLNNSD